MQNEKLCKDSILNDKITRNTVTANVAYCIEAIRSNRIVVDGLSSAYDDIKSSINKTISRKYLTIGKLMEIRRIMKREGVDVWNSDMIEKYDNLNKFYVMTLPTNKGWGNILMDMSWDV